MVRNKIKWKFSFIFCLLTLNVFIKSLPIERSLPSIIVSETSFPKLDLPKIVEPKVISESESKSSKVVVAENVNKINATSLAIGGSNTDTSQNSSTNSTRSYLRSVRPGQTVLNYAVEITIDGNRFQGRVVIDLRLATDLEDPIVLHCEDLEINEVRAGVNSEANAQPVDFNAEDGVLEIFPNRETTSHVVVIQYSGQINNFAAGMFRADFKDHEYIGMNLHPTYARRVFPCMDDLDGAATISFTFEGIPFNSIVANSRTEDDNQNQHRELFAPPNLWGMIAHNFNNILLPTPNVVLYGRSNLNQESLAGIAIQTYMTAFNEWTGKNYFEIDLNQDGQLHIFALPDTNVEWHALSTICLWEPHVFMNNAHSVMQEKIAIVKIAEAMARQWFGYVVYPANWKDLWVISGIASHAAQNVVRDFQSSNNDDMSLLDMNTIFTVDVIQEALYLDAHSNAVVLFPDDDITDESDVRHHSVEVLKLKASALMRMLRLVLSDENDEDYLQKAAQELLHRRTHTPVSVSEFFNTVEDGWNNEGQLIDDIGEFLEPWVKNTGYPVLSVQWRTSTTVNLFQERFSLVGTNRVDYSIPITFTTSLVHDYNNLHPTMNLETSSYMFPLGHVLDEDDFVIFNLQGQGFYRVNYDHEFWERIIAALDDPERRQYIHPLNRATLIDDALNLARAGLLEYEIALQVALTWVHETEYGPWRAFIRNMEFLKNRLVSFVDEDEDRDDPDIYTRVIRRTMGAFEDAISFSPDPSLNEPAMTSLTRGIVMDHACRSSYDPCVAAAIDWFFDPNSDEPAVNPNIPNDIRPAVFCTMVREQGDDSVDLLYEYLESDLSLYERLVVLESLGCSLDEGVVDRLMRDTITSNGPFGVEERVKILTAIIKSGHQNINKVIDFMSSNTNAIRDMYGGPQRLEELLVTLAHYIVNEDSEFQFRFWVITNNNNLDDSEDIGSQAIQIAKENMEWNERYLEEVYDWIDENDAHTVIVSFTLLCIAALISLFNS